MRNPSDLIHERDISNPQEKILEVKIRPYPNQSQERPDQDGASRVFLSMNALLDLGLASGQTCYIWKIGEGVAENGKQTEKREAIAWLSTEKNLSKKVAQVSKVFQEACGLKLGDELGISSAGGVVPKVVVSVGFRDVTAEAGDGIEELDEEDKVHWEWHLSKHLGECGYSYLRKYKMKCVLISGSESKDRLYRHDF